MSDDMALLRQYTREGVEEAFATLVRKYVDLVHSAALRQVRSPDLAQEVAQSVFIELARNGERLAANTLLIAWLYQVTRRRAIDVVRRENRRQAREKTGEYLKAMNSTGQNWSEVEPLLEEAMDTLESDDRAAVLLRYFENKTLREVGTALGTSENAAQKRVSRAIERLHSFFTSKGIAGSAGGLAVAISSNSVKAAPLNLAAAIAGKALEAGALVTAGTTAAAIKTLSMTTTQKALLTTALLTAIGTAVYQGERNSQLREKVRQMEVETSTASLAETLGQVTGERDTAMKRVAALEQENQRFERNSSELLRLRDEVTRLRAQVAGLNAAPAGSLAAQDTNSLQHILGILSDREEKTTDSMRYQAAEKLRSLGPEALAAVPEFNNLLHSETEPTRYAGARALAFMSERSPDAYQQLTNALVDPDPQVRDAASHGIGLLFNQDFKNVDVLATLPTVLRNLEDSNRTVRADSIQTLRQFIDRQHWSGKDAQANVLIPHLIARLSDDYSYSRMNAAMALQSFGEKARAAVPHLRPLLSDPDEQVRRLAASALARIEDTADQTNSP